MAPCSTHRELLVIFLGLILSFVSITAACDPLYLNPLLVHQDLCSAEFPVSGVFQEHEILPLREAPTEASSSVYDVVPIPGKGFGVVANRKLPRRTKIIIEEALISVPMPEMVPGQGFRMADMLTNVEDAFHSLSPAQQQEFLDLHEHRFPTEENQSKLLTILRSNAYNTGDDYVGIFPKIARINHSCRPNSGNFWSMKRNQRVIYAFRDIERGEEVTVSYIPLTKSTKERQARLFQYGFTCGCDACQSVESSRKRVKIADFIEVLEQKVHLDGLSEKSAERMLSKSMSLVDMIEEEELADYLAKAYHFAAVFHEKKGDLKWIRWNLSQRSNMSMISA
ncbi:SET domain-containing protein [Mollisia scopiformis]|uniref:SET domain-containing protein n=1 Tax=Mollisia scopiformis TaxID=149040 RepID=A0A194XCR4_MOLSC|nr:SET domain-containing protein [Mollisia scopiformis]KUJ17963.1 SET domain-containing protein [Mollisia scopiformis]